MRIPGTILIIGKISVRLGRLGRCRFCDDRIWRVFRADCRVEGRTAKTNLSRPTSSRRTSSGLLPLSPLPSSPAASGVDKAEVGQGAFEIRQERSFDRDSAQSAAPIALRADQASRATSA
jgi:hypothetical protein